MACSKDEYIKLDNKSWHANLNCNAINSLIFATI